MTIDFHRWCGIYLTPLAHSASPYHERQGYALKNDINFLPQSTSLLQLTQVSLEPLRLCFE